MLKVNKREFLRTSGSAGLALLLGDRVWARFANTPVDRLVEDVLVAGAQA